MRWILSILWLPLAYCAAWAIFARVGVGGGPLLAHRLLPAGVVVPDVLAQETEPPTVLVPLPRRGSQWKAKAPDGQMHIFTVKDSSRAYTVTPDFGYVICPNGHPVTTNATLTDTVEATQLTATQSITHLCCPAGSTRCVPGTKQESVINRTGAPNPRVTAPHN